MKNSWFYVKNTQDPFFRYSIDFNASQFFIID